MHTDRSYRWDLENTPIPEPDLPEGWVLRHLEGEHEANNRRAASHAAFQSTMTDEDHLNRYLKFMRSPVYDSERDLVAVAPDGRIAAFMVWWPDSTGVAQIEPFGTHTDFHRQGAGRALMYYGLEEDETGRNACDPGGDRRTTSRCDIVLFGCRFRGCRSCSLVGRCHRLREPAVHWRAELR